MARFPDVGAAGLQLQAADWRVGTARVDRLPAVRLFANTSFRAEAWSAVFDNRMANLADSLTGPVFDAGRGKAEVACMQALAEECLGIYRLRIMDSMKEVELVMMRETKQSEYTALLTRKKEVLTAVNGTVFERLICSC